MRISGKLGFGEPGMPIRIEDMVSHRRVPESPGKAGKNASIVLAGVEGQSDARTESSFQLFHRANGVCPEVSVRSTARSAAAGTAAAVVQQAAHRSAAAGTAAAVVLLEEPAGRSTGRSAAAAVVKKAAHRGAAAGTAAAGTAAAMVLEESAAAGTAAVVLEKRTAAAGTAARTPRSREHRPGPDGQGEYAR